ncbi:hypothetical protein TIFTF001_013231 [Ficus carica]|uniref:Uncharacterized protein n=1 Tax=Ficus carica TaxID=3494 RepID=A0AA88DI81_FICCA|nr:hypothetical protein TIFTF001_013231 [Ficus carica]
MMETQPENTMHGGRQNLDSNRSFAWRSRLFLRGTEMTSDRDRDVSHGEAKSAEISEKAAAGMAGEITDDGG